MRFKYHKESGAFEHIPSPEIVEMNSLKKENKSLTEENKELKESMNSLLKLLGQKKLLSAKEIKELKI